MTSHGGLHDEQKQQSYVAAAFVEQFEERATRGRTILPMLWRALETEAGYAELVAQAGDLDAFEAEVARERAMLELVRRREPCARALESRGVDDATFEELKRTAERFVALPPPD